MKEEDIQVEAVSGLAETRGPNWQGLIDLWHQADLPPFQDSAYKIFSLAQKAFEKVFCRINENIHRTIQEKKEWIEQDLRIAKKIHSQNIFYQKNFAKVAKIHPL